MTIEEADVEKVDEEEVDEEAREELGPYNLGLLVGSGSASVLGSES